jgi:hypothetical protein
LSAVTWGENAAEVLIVQAENAIEKAAATASRAEIRRAIGQKLRAYYGPIEPLPDRLTEALKPLLFAIDKRDSKTR